MNIDSALVRELAELLAETGLSEIEVEDGERKIRVARKAASAAPAPVYAPAPAAAPAAPAAAPAAASQGFQHHRGALAERLHKVAGLLQRGWLVGALSQRHALLLGQTTGAGLVAKGV